MVSHEFDNDHDIVLCALIALLDFFEKEDKLFAAHCIWWLTSIIQFTEILTYYCQYKIFPSEYLSDRLVMPLDKPREPKDLVPVDLISELGFNSHEIYITQRHTTIHPERQKQFPTLSPIRSGTILNTSVKTQSRKFLLNEISKRPELSKLNTNKELENSLGWISQDDQRVIRSLLVEQYTKGA